MQSELKALPTDMRARFLHIAELLETFGPQKVGMPHIRALEGKLWEMRLQGRDGIARAGLSQTEVAQRMGTTQSAVARMESGKRLPSLRTVERFAQAVGGHLVFRIEQRARRVKPRAALVDSR